MIVPYQSLLRRWMPNLLLSISLLFLCSCAELGRQGATTPAAAHERYSHALAEQLFMLGDYSRARAEYEQLLATARSRQDKNQALYGLACTQMMLADTIGQLVEAIDSLQSWDINKGTAPFTENRHLLILALKQQGKLLQENNLTLIKLKNQQKSVIAKQQAKITQMAADNETLQNEVKKLHKQIEEIEAIDENVQNKRNPHD